YPPPPSPLYLTWQELRWSCSPYLSVSQVLWWLPEPLRAAPPTLGSISPATALRRHLLVSLPLCGGRLGRAMSIRSQSSIHRILVTLPITKVSCQRHSRSINGEAARHSGDGSRHGTGTAEVEIIRCRVR